MTIRVGILGGGNISETHARAAAAIPGVEVAAVHGRNAGRTAVLADRFGGRPYTDLEPFFSHPSLDVVLIGSPSGLHAEQARAAVRHGLHVLVEKPLDVSTQRIDALIGEAEAAGVKVGVFYQNRVAPDIAWTRQLIEAGGLGEVFLASARVKWYRPPEYYGGSAWRGTWALDGGGALMNQGIHTVDLLLWMLGDLDRVYARARTAVHAIEVEDTVVACLEFRSGAIATLEATTAAFPGFPRQIEISGTNGSVVITNDRVSQVALHDPSDSVPPEGVAGHEASAEVAVVSTARGHRLILEDFLSAIATATEPLVGGREARRSVAAVEAIYASAREGVPVIPG